MSEFSEAMGSMREKEGRLEAVVSLLEKVEAAQAVHDELEYQMNKANVNFHMFPVLSDSSLEAVIPLLEELLAAGESDDRETMREKATEISDVLKSDV